MNAESLLELLKSAAEVPRRVWAPVVGTLLSWGLTQWLKRNLPPADALDLARLRTRSIAFGLAWGGTAVVWGPADPNGWLVGFVVGLWTPALWSLLTAVLRRRWPWLYDAINDPKE